MAIFLLIPLIVVLVFLSTILGALLGALLGYIIEITPIIKDLVTNGLKYLGVNAEGHLVEIGAALGFIGGIIGGFFHSRKSD